jgi:hypothetical protein
MADSIGFVLSYNNLLWDKRIFQYQSGLAIKKKKNRRRRIAELP